MSVCRIAVSRRKATLVLRRGKYYKAFGHRTTAPLLAGAPKKAAKMGHRAK